MGIKLDLLRGQGLVINSPLVLLVADQFLETAQAAALDIDGGFGDRRIFITVLGDHLTLLLRERTGVLSKGMSTFGNISTRHLGMALIALHMYRRHNRLVRGARDGFASDGTEIDGK